MGPEDLDDLLASIRAEAKKESALALYEGIKETDLVDENIDERILKLLGIEDVFDIDYGTYTSLLKEKLVASRSFDKKLSTEEDELLVSEFKRVKGKTGRFKLNKKKITAETIGTTGPIQISKDKFFLASKAIVPVTPAETQDSSKDIQDIEKALDDILKSLTLQNKEKKKRTEEEKRKSEDRRRRQREGDLEKPLTQLKSLAKKIIAPAQGILDRIFRFIKFTLLGYAFNQLVKWFSDPKNADKVKSLGRFLKDWWPALLTAYGLFATPFGKFIRTSLKMLRGFIPQMARFIAANPWLSLYTAAAIGGAVKIKESERMKPLTQKSQKEIDKTLQSKETPWYQKLGASFANQSLNAPGGPKNPIGLPTPSAMYNGGGLIGKRSFFGGGLVDREIDVNDIAFEGGGGINDNTGMRITGAGPDTQLIAAQPGEIIMSKKAVDKHGANFFLDLNKKAGGTNIPKIANNIQLAAGGGLIKRTIKTFQGGGMVGGALNQLGRFLPGTGSVIAPRYTEMGFQNKFLGIPLNRRVLNQQAGERLSPKAVNRYNQAPTAPSTIRPWSAFDSTQVSVPKSRGTSGGSFVGDAFKNFGANVKTIKGAAKRQEVMMREMGVEPSGYVNLRGQPINMGPQSRSVVPGPRVIVSKTTYTVLPPIKAPNKEPSIARGSKIPEFIISGNNDSRSKIALSLGISDLVGAS
jgi:hypothetical protein